MQTREPLSVECALFLTQCLQANESDRISLEELSEHPFLKLEQENEGGEVRCTILDRTAYQDEMLRMTDISKTSILEPNKKMQRTMTNQNSQVSTRNSTEVGETNTFST